MLQVRTRAPEPADFEAYADARGSLTRNVLLVALPISAVIAGSIYLLSRSLLAAGLVGGALFAVSAISNFGFFRELSRRRNVASSSSLVEAIEVTASRVLDVEPHGSHGPALVFFTGDGRALLLVGQWLNDQQSFPSLVFSVYRWADSKKPIRIESTGPQIEPEATNVRLPDSPRLTDVQVISASPESLQSDLDMALSSARE